MACVYTYKGTAMTKAEFMAEVAKQLPTMISEGKLPGQYKSSRFFAGKQEATQATSETPEAPVKPGEPTPESTAARETGVTPEAQKPPAAKQEALKTPEATPAFPEKIPTNTATVFREIDEATPEGRKKAEERLKSRNPRAYSVLQDFDNIMEKARESGMWNPETRTMTAGGKSIVLPGDADVKAWLSEGGRAVVESQSPGSVFDQVMGSLDSLREKAKTETQELNGASPDEVIMRSGVDPKELLKLPMMAMKALNIGNDVIASVTGKIQDASARILRKGMKNSNKALGVATNISQGLLKNLSKTETEVDKTRRMQGGVRSAATQALMFYDKAAAIVGGDPLALARVHQVMDPEVYEGKVATGQIPRVELSDLTAEERNLYDLLRQNLDYIHEWHYKNGLISEETYLKNKGNYSPRFWEMETEEDPEINAMYQQMGKSVNRKYIKQRQELDDMMKDSDDIIRDPVFATAMRLAQTLRNEAVLNYAEQVSKTDATHRGTGDPPPGYILLEGPKYGALNGKYVARDVAEDFKGYFLTNKILNEGYRVFRLIDAMPITQKIKAAKTVYDFGVFLGNILNNFTFAFTTGVDPFNFASKLGDANKQIDEKSDNYMYILKEGVLGTDILTQDVKARSEKVRGIGVSAQPQNTGIRGSVREFMDKTKQWYGKVDDISKMAAFEALLDQGYSKEAAARKVFEGFQNYGQVGRYYDIASKTPAIGNRYIKFMADSQLRIRKNNITKRPLTYAAYLGLMSMAATMLSQTSDETEEEREAREAMPYKPKINLPEPLEKFGIKDIPLFANTKYGEVNYARLLSPDYIYDVGDKGYLGDIESFTKYLPYQVKYSEKNEDSAIPFRPQFNDILFGPLFQLLTDEDFRGKPIFDPDKPYYGESKLSSYDQWLNAARFLANAYVPYYGKISSVYSGASKEPDFYGNVRTPEQALINMLVKVKKMDREEIISAYGKDIGFLYSGMENIEKEQVRIGNSTQSEIEAIVANDQYSEAYKNKLIEKKIDQAVTKNAELEDRKARKFETLLKKLDLIQPVLDKKP